MRRPDIPRQLEREVLLEAGHRCAIPACRQVPVVIAHIEPWAKVKMHNFDNLIALCPTCHARYDKNEIDRKSMLQYKVNLSVLNGRYGDLERRVLRYFAANPDLNEIWLNRGFDILLMYLIDDGLLKKNDDLESYFSEEGIYYFITPKGREFIEKWIKAEEL